MDTEVMKQKNCEPWNLESALDVLIVLLYSEGQKGQLGEPIEGITRLDKLMYLLSNSADFAETVKKGYEFKADNFGPFAPELFDDVEALKQEKIIEVVSQRETKNKIETIDEEYVEKEVDSENATSWKSYPVERYELTARGKEVGASLYGCLTQKQKEELKNIKSTFGDMSLNKLLHYVYSKYPAMAEKSKIKDKVLR